MVGRIAEASNATLLATVTLDGETRHCVYKPVTGERPLWDFPTHTLYRREVAAYLVSAAAGWSLVPPTVLRDGPAGEGSVQAWIYGGDGSGYRPAPEPGAGVIDVVAPDRVPRGWLTVLRAQTWDGDRVALAHADDPQLRAMAAFDVVVDNADRKGGHVLRERDGTLRGVDHGLTFNVDRKLRTVLWGWAGRRLDDDVESALIRLEAALAGDLGERLAELLSPEEARLTARRLDVLRERGRYPKTPTGRPAIPWPAF